MNERRRIRNERRRIRNEFVIEFFEGQSLTQK